MRESLSKRSQLYQNNTLINTIMIVVCMEIIERVSGEKIAKDLDTVFGGMCLYWGLSGGTLSEFGIGPKYIKKKLGWLSSIEYGWFDFNLKMNPAEIYFHAYPGHELLVKEIGEKLEQLGYKIKVEVRV